MGAFGTAQKRNERLKGEVARRTERLAGSWFKKEGLNYTVYLSTLTLLNWKDTNQIELIYGTRHVLRLFSVETDWYIGLANILIGGGFNTLLAGL